MQICPYRDLSTVRVGNTLTVTILNDAHALEITLARVKRKNVYRPLGSQQTFKKNIRGTAEGIDFTLTYGITCKRFLHSVLDSHDPQCAHYQQNLLNI